MYKPGQLVEVSGLAAEGFPASYVSAVILQYTAAGAEVKYLEFIDDDGGQLKELISNDRLRPSLPQAAKFHSWDELQAGMAIELHQDDVWWQGLVLRKTPAGVHVYMPDIDHSSTFVKLLRKLRPAYDWVPGPAAAAAAAGAAPEQQQQQQQGHWEARHISLERLSELRLTDVQQLALAASKLPPQLPHAPVFSELTDFDRTPAAASGVPSPPDAPVAVNDQTCAPAAAAAAAATEGKPIKRTGSATGSVDAAAADGAAGTGLPDQGQKENAAAAAAAAAASAGDAGVQGEEEKQPAGDAEMADAVQQQQPQQQPQPLDDESEGVDNDDEQQQRQQGGKQLSRAGSSAGTARPSNLRRSAREAKKRVVYVDGHPVLRDNLYGEEGEPSVFDKELAAKPYTEQGYPTAPPLSPAAQHRQQQLQHLREQRRQQQQQREQRCLSAGGSKPPRGPGGGAGLAARRTHNAGIKATKQASAGVRAAYLATHLAKLRPFIAPAVAEALERAAAAAPHGALNLPEPPSSQPEQIKAVLRDYQLEGLAWMVSQHQRGLNSILADEMGLGKTLQSISFLAHLKWNMGVEGPHLVVVPLSVMSSWMLELGKWCPELRAVRLHTSDPEERKRLKKEVLARPESFDVAVTTYEMVTSPDFGRPIQSTLTWRYLVLDEGHRVRNDTLTVKALKLVRRGNVLLLTGTPLQNNMVELYGLLSFMFPDVFTTPGPFEAAFNLVKGQVDEDALSAAHYLLRPFCLRRVKDEVEVSLPPKVETRIAVPLSEQQTFWYRRLLLRNHEMLSALENTVASSSSSASQLVTTSTGSGNAQAWRKLLNLIMQLRKIVNHPFMLPGSEPCREGISSLGELLDGSGKLAVLHRLLAKLKARGHRVVLFSQFTMMLDILEDYLEQAGYEYTRLDGSVNRVQRMINISQFMKPNSNLFIFLASTRAGGLGLNLQSADTVILYDSDWNPQWDLQAMARVHRIGQTKPVHVYRLITSSSVEERMLQRADAKLYLDQMVNRGSTAKAEQLDSMNTGELLSMLTFGADRILANDSGKPPSDADLDLIIDRSKDAAAKAEAAEAAAAAGRGSSSSGQKQPEVKQEDGAAAGPSSSNGQQAAASDGAGSSKAAAGGGGGAVLKSLQLTAANFNAEQAPANTFMLNGVDYSAAALAKLREAAAAQGGSSSGSRSKPPLAVRKLQRSDGSGGGDEEGVKATLAAIAREYWSKKKWETGSAEGEAHRPERARHARLIDVEGYQVLKVNNYNAEQGGISAWEETAGARPANGGQPPKRKLQKAGRDYAHSDTCQVCWDGGDLICCDVCPAAYHADCLGQDPSHLAARPHWACPHHTCATCGRGPAASGGLLFRCGVCECSWCEDHLPAEHEILGEWPMFQALGQAHPNNACFVLCGPDCQDLQQRVAPAIKHTIEEYEANPDLRFREAVSDETGALKAKKKARKMTKASR